MVCAQNEASRLMSTSAPSRPALAAKKTWSLPIMLTTATGMPNIRSAICTTGSRLGKGRLLLSPYSDKA